MTKEKAQISEGIISVFINTALFAFKFWAGYITGSIALIADAWHTMSDSITSVFVIISAKLSSKKADKEHPFGHGRWEHISSIFISFTLGFIGYQFLSDSIVRLSNRETVTYGKPAIIVTAASIIVKELLAQYAFYVSRKTGNAIVKADGWHHRSDALSSVVILVGIFLCILFKDTLWWVDGALGILVALTIFYVTYDIMKGAITKILGEEPGQEFIDKIMSEVRDTYKENLVLHHFHIHNYVMHKEMTLHIRLQKNLTIEEGHRIATNIEDIIKDKFDTVATIHVEPLD